MQARNVMPLKAELGKMCRIDSNTPLHLFLPFNLLPFLVAKLNWQPEAGVFLMHFLQVSLLGCRTGWRRTRKGKWKIYKENQKEKPGIISWRAGPL